MMQPMDDRLQLENSGPGGVNSGTFVRRAEYICQGSACLHCDKCMEACPTKAIFYHQNRGFPDDGVYLLWLPGLIMKEF